MRPLVLLTMPGAVALVNAGSATMLYALKAAVNNYSIILVLMTKTFVMSTNNKLLHFANVLPTPSMMIHQPKALMKHGTALNAVHGQLPNDQLLKPTLISTALALFGIAMISIYLWIGNIATAA